MEFPTLEVTELNRPFWEGLEQGVLRFQRCRRCQHAWLPPRRECPNCLAADSCWEAASGRGRVVSWVVYHVAYHDAFRDRLPYNVAVIELDEGPRLITNVTCLPEALAIDLPVRLAVQRDFGLALPRFAPEQANDPLLPQRSPAAPLRRHDADPADHRRPQMRNGA
ncbi:MAG: OB-fold domain-containing protein [Acetobacteraceae bacterium]|nr:OB-fold domain-containing protein [Acetobacteraceae bacterium]